MNGPMRQKLYVIIIKRDGEFCRCCGMLSFEAQLVIDHKDNNNSNNSLENIQLLCRKCNYLKNPRKGPVDNCVSVIVLDGTVTEVQINRRKEPLFRNFVLHLLNEHDEVPQNEIINSGAEEVGISQETARRYLNKMCSGRGILEKVNRVNTVLIKYKPIPPGL